MNMLTLGAAGIAAVLLAVWMKGVKAEYGLVKLPQSCVWDIVLMVGEP